MNVTFATKCWEKDWFSLASGGAQARADSCGFPFFQKVLAVNNVSDYGAVAFSRPYGWEMPSASADTCAKYGAVPEDTGYVYASGEFAALDAARGDFFCFVQGDCFPDAFVEDALKVLNEEPDVLIVSPRSECNTWHGRDGYDLFASDHAFVGRTEELRGLDWEAFRTADIPEFPDHGGFSFEYRLAAAMRKAGKRRKILPGHWVEHQA